MTQQSLFTTAQHCRPTAPTMTLQANRGNELDQPSIKMPNILLLTDNCIAKNHGSGTVLLRHFSAYPTERLLNVFSFKVGEPALAQHCHIRPRLLPGLLKKGLIQLGLRQPGSGQNRLESWAFQKSLRKPIEATGFVPDLIYATCFGLRGFTMLARLAAEYGGTIPIIQHFFDYQRDGNGAVDRMLVQLSPALTEVWSLGEMIAAEVAKQMQRTVPIVPIFHCDVPAVCKTEHRPFGADFQAVMVGNCWIPEVLHDIRTTWRLLGEQVGGLRPIKWYAHPVTVDTIRQRRIPFAPEIEYVGFYQGHELSAQLQHADLAIIPFNRETAPENDYARFSLPSRITEIASVGLPVFCAAGPQTELQHYVKRHAIGVCSLPSQREQFQRDLLNFMKNQRQRGECGMNARKLAANEFDLQQYQAWLYQTLATVANSHGDSETG